MTTPATTLASLIARIRPADAAAALDAQRRLDDKTKPRGSLGQLETLACRLAAARGGLPAAPRKAIVVMGADHGVADEGVSAYPAEVTAQMLANFARGGAAINVLGRHVGAELVVVDMGTRSPLPDLPGVISRRIGAGTNNFTRGPAMSVDDAVKAVHVGAQVAEELADRGVTLLAVGEMGIGNSTAASALCAALLDARPEAVVGRGTGVDDEGLARKRAAVRRALEVNAPDPAQPLEVLAALGGFEIAGLVGVVLGAAARRVPVVVDGFIASAAALVAARLAPAAGDYLIAGHRGVEPGHARLLDALRLQPLLALELRLGEGTGAALALSLCDAAVRLLLEMATFSQAGVSDSGA